jgi:hypothetical protein
MNERQAAIFGCDPDAMMAELTVPITEYGLAHVLQSLLSDAQEMMVAGQPESARKAINRVKHIVAAKLPRVRDTPADVAVQDEVSELRQLYAQTTPGVWHALPGRALAISGTVLPGGYSGFDVLRGMGAKAAEGKRNVQLCARMHNATPALLDAAELVQHVLTVQEKLPMDKREVYIVDRAQATLSALKKSQL